MSNLTGERIKELLEENSISAYKLSKLTNFSKSYISQVINGKKKPSEKFLEKISEELYVEKSYLMESYYKDLLEKKQNEIRKIKEII